MTNVTTILLLAITASLLMFAAVLLAAYDDLRRSGERFDWDTFGLAGSVIILLTMAGVATLAAIK